MERQLKLSDIPADEWSRFKRWCPTMRKLFTQKMKSLEHLEGKSMKIDELKKECGGHWSGHPDYPVEDWKYLVSCNETRLGYWEWVKRKVEDGE